MKVVHDEVCGMDIDAADAAARVEYEGTTYYFCGEGCRQAFETDPGRYASRSASAEGHDGHHHHQD